MGLEAASVETTTSPAVAIESTEASSSPGPESRRIVRIRKPGSGRRRVAVRPPTSSTVRVPVQRDPADEERANNALDSLEEGANSQGPSSAFGSRLQEESSGSPTSSLPPRSPLASRTERPLLLDSPADQTLLPLTYYTTYTYLTTVLRGSHTLVTSRVSATSSISSQVLDESVIHFLKQQSTDSIVPTRRVVNVGSKTKGPTTTIVNVASEIRATHSDLPGILAAASPATKTRKPLVEQLQTIALSHLDKIPKTYLTKYTYYYTIIDGSSTRKSTRSEVASSRASGTPLVTLLSL